MHTGAVRYDNGVGIAGIVVAVHMIRMFHR